MVKAMRVRVIEGFEMGVNDKKYKADDVLVVKEFEAFEDCYVRYFHNGQDFTIDYIPKDKVIICEVMKDV